MHPPANGRATELDGVAAALGLRIDGILRRTDKSLLAAAHWNDTPVVVKLLTDSDPFWIAKWHHEINVYRIFQDHQPPVRAPQLLHSDGQRLLVLELLPGAPIDHDRYPAQPVDTAMVDAAIASVGALASWHPVPPEFEPIFDYPDRVARYHAHGLFDDSDRHTLTRLLDICSDQWEVNHGDPLPSNLIYDGATCGMVDWEFTGLYLRGFDLAMLHTLLAATPHAREAIERHVARQNIEVPFAVNLAMTLTRELRLHQELPDDHPHRGRLGHLATAWSDTRQRIRALACQAGG